MNICGRCYADVEEIFKPYCNEKPEYKTKNIPLGMYHCPECGAMCLAGSPHPYVCKECLKR